MAYEITTEAGDTITEETGDPIVTEDYTSASRNAMIEVDATLTPLLFITVLLEETTT